MPFVSDTLPAMNREKRPVRQTPVAAKNVSDSSALENGCSFRFHAENRIAGFEELGRSLVFREYGEDDLVVFSLLRPFPVKMLDKDLSGIHVGAHDEIFQGDPVLVSIDAISTYCHLLAQEPNRDATTWGCQRSPRGRL